MKLVLNNARTGNSIEIFPSKFTDPKTKRVFSGIEFEFIDDVNFKQSFIFDFKSSKMLLSFLEETVSQLEKSRINQNLDI